MPWKAYLQILRTQFESSFTFTLFIIACRHSYTATMETKLEAVVSPGKSLLRAGAMVKVAPFGQGTTVKAEREEDGMVEVKLKYGTAYLRRELVLPGLLDMNPAVRRTYETYGAPVAVVRVCRLCGERTRGGLSWAASSRDGVGAQEGCC